MFNKTTVSVIAVLVAASAVTADARTRHASRHARPYAGAAASSFEPARMIQVRPGLWVGSYQCIVDLDRGGRDCSSGI
jgi:hypothetical protein